MLRQILKRQYDPVNNNVFFPLAKGSECLLQRMALLQSMEVHRGCVNTVVWDAPGNLLLSGSDDQQLVICDPWERMTKTRIHTAHRANIFSAKFMPHTANRKIISCSGDGIVIYTDVERQEETYDCKFTCHASTCYDIITMPDDAHTFLTCGEDDTVRWFDLRIKQQCSVRDCQEDVLLNMGRAVTAVAVNPVTPYHLAVATQDSTIRIYDRRTLGTRATDSYLEQSDRALVMRLKPDKMEGKSHRVTSLRYSHTGREVLASYSSDFLYLFDTQNYKEVSLKTSVDTDSEANSGPTLKRLRLRGDWSDTGPQALPESEMRNQAGGNDQGTSDVGQARPTLHATLMQRMTDVLSRMLNDPNTRASVQRPADSQPQANPTPEQAADGDGNGLQASGSGAQSDSNTQPNSDIQSDTNTRSDSNIGSDSNIQPGSNIQSDANTRSDSNIQSDSSIQPGNNIQPNSSTQSDSNIQPSTSTQETADSSMDSSIKQVADVDIEPPDQMESQSSDQSKNNESKNKSGQSDKNKNNESERSIGDSEIGESERNSSMEPVSYMESESGTSLQNNEIIESDRSIGNSGMSTGECEEVPRESERNSSLEPVSYMESERGTSLQGNPESNASIGDEGRLSEHSNTRDTNIEGLQNRITSLRQGFVDRHQVEPSVNLSYSGRGAASGVISLGVGDEVDRDYTDPNTPQSTTETPHTPGQLGESDSVFNQLGESESVLEDQIPGPSEESQGSATPFSRFPGSKPPPLTTSTSSPAICDMEVRPSSSAETGRGSSGQDTIGPGTHGTRATELNLGPALDFGDDDSDDESTSARTASARMASAIERAVQRARGERAPGVGGEAEATVPQASVKQCYKGHRNARTMIKEACFWGDSHVMSGSDCGRVFAWERATGRLVMLWEADRHVVNCLQPHPTLPVLATSGIDYDVKLWAPTCEEPYFDQEKAMEITQRNEALLEETRDTITVPATFMIRMLASLNQIRRGTSFAERWRNRRQARRQGEDDEQGNNAD